MFLKLLGGSFVIIASGLFGIALSNKYSGRPRELRRLRTSLQMLETEIIYGATPLPQACTNISLKLESTWSSFYDCISNSLIKGEYYTAKEAWDNAVYKILKEISLDKIDIELIKGFGNILGGSDREDQLKHFKLFYTQLGQHEQMADEERKKNEKMYKSLGFLFGILIFVIFI